MDGTVGREFFEQGCVRYTSIFERVTVFIPSREPLVFVHSVHLDVFVTFSSDYRRED